MRNLRRAIGAVLVFAGVLAAVPASAQQVNTGLGIGALAGWTFTTVRTETNDFDLDTSGGNGWVFGIWFGGNRDGRAGLMGEVNYITKKFKATEGDDEFTTKTTYIELPVLLRINTGSRERDKPSLYFLVGPVFDINIKSAEEINGDDIEEDSPDDFYRGLYIGLMFGAGFEVARIGIEGRYSIGLKSVLGTDAAIETGFGDVKLNTLSIVAKVRFN
jgi:hypothetical protein